jgi:hypothetical protein
VQSEWSVPTVRDRIVQGAVLQVIEPIFEREFATQSYGFRPGKGCKEALRRVEELLSSGRHWVVDADLKAGLNTSSIVRPMSTRQSMATYEGGCAASSGTRENEKAGQGHSITTDGPIATSPRYTWRNLKLGCNGPRNRLAPSPRTSTRVLAFESHCA